MASFRSAVTGPWVSKAWAMMFPRESVKETRRPQFTYEEITYAISALEAQAGTKRNEKVRNAVLGKLVRMMG